ncbi:MAG: ABC-type multidrug transport system ATPase subunit, partial [Parvicellaceae bacterium]
MSDIVLKIEGLSKNYKNVQALKGLSITVEAGMVFGILGPNGSGKTTTLGILLGVLNASSGSYSWFDNGSKDANRKRIGALLETPNFYPYLSAVKNLRIVAQIKKLDNVDQRIDNVLSSVNLLERKDSAFKTFSLGMKQRLAIASALLNDPEVLVLDEPTNGLDPQGIAEIRQ